ncbi:MAG: acyl-CoA thioesterase [Bacteroidetes bacterium]|nr:acyl-CoA thioesterase [Bacteroidota bacterium]MBU1116684.1 acyl-CoA thioesterase [Bacteroidota bacterium]MBU1800049.1 acyl-CoA thioesterase [Bacteroidota bacterium]
MKTVSYSIITMTELVLPQHTNQLGNLLGGQLMHWIDICAALASSKHAGRICVTASVDKIDFHHPIKLGDVVTIVASVNRVFNSSMEVGVSVCSENYTKGKKLHTNSAYLTFVGLNSDGVPVKSSPIVPETTDEKRRYEEAQVRRQARLNMRDK